MPKMKTHKGYSKVASKKKNGSIKISKVGGAHNSGTKPSKFARKKRKSTVMSKGDAKRLTKMSI